ncbi:hypothetical protein NPIL_220861 [Nephila pilipes]|uniref:Uncharacterized protein n=1 Tax=Nephila pilipes TaxID=299642 RepID=A0A8X6NIF5_NEPPI|nr:hypothetical protein NPIL_220861 [Nephila pilipes]
MTKSSRNSQVQGFYHHFLSQNISVHPLRQEWYLPEEKRHRAMGPLPFPSYPVTPIFSPSPTLRVADTDFIARIFRSRYATMDSNIFLSVENGSSIMHENDRTEERHIYIRIYQSISVDENVPVRLKR